MTVPNFEQARRYALERLERDLPATYLYHSVAHTRDDVVPAVERLAALSHVTGEDLLLLCTAAYFHDLGFIERIDGHEAVGVQIAAAVLPTYGYTPAQIERISGMIMATRLPQSPTNLLEQFLADADLDVFGRPDFFERNRLLREELTLLQGSISDQEWYRGQITFLQNHEYWTEAAHQLRDPGKQRNLARLNELLNASEG